MNGAIHHTGWNCRARKKGFVATADTKQEGGGMKRGIFAATIAFDQIMKNRNSIQRLVYEWLNDGCKPSWWHAHVYYDYYSRRRLMVAWPLNYIVLSAKWLQWKWDKSLGRDSWIDRHVEKSVNAVISERKAKQ